MKKNIFFVMIAVFSSSIFAGYPAEYNPQDGSVVIPELVIIGQEGKHLVKMEQKEKSLNFEVSEITPSEEENEGSDELLASYDLETGLVEIPLVVVLSTKEAAPLKTYTVKMQQQDGMNFEVTEAIPVEVKSRNKSQPNIMQKSSVVKCSKTTTDGRRRVVKSYFMGSSCPKGWIKLR